MAVYTRLSKAEIEKHLENYQLGKLINFKEIIEGIDNSNFVLETEKGRFILTIFEQRINKSELPFFIGLKLHLALNGILCPQPISNKFGEVIANLGQKKSVIVSFLSGKILASNSNGFYQNIEVMHCGEVGKILAEMHLAAQNFKMSRINDLGVFGFEKLFLKFANLLPQYQANLDAEISQNIQLVKTLWNQDLPNAALHLDLFPDNVFFNEAKKISGVIDFYFAANDLMIYDFAIAVNAWCFDENNLFCEEKFTAMFSAYEKVRKFSAAENDFLKIALLAAAMRFLLTRINDMFFTPKNSLVKMKNPQEYLAKVRFFRQKI